MGPPGPGVVWFRGANGEVMSKYSAGVYSTGPAGWVPDHSAELQAEVNAWAGGGRWVEKTYVTVYRRDGARTGVVIGAGFRPTSGASSPHR